MRFDKYKTFFKILFMHCLIFFCLPSNNFLIYLQKESKKRVSIKYCIKYYKVFEKKKNIGVGVRNVISSYTWYNSKG